MGLNNPILTISGSSIAIVALDEKEF